MLQDLIDQAILEEERGIEKWGAVDTTPVDFMIAIQEEIGEVAHAINHQEGWESVTQEIAEAVGLLSRLYSLYMTKQWK